MNNAINKRHVVASAIRVLHEYGHRLITTGHSGSLEVHARAYADIPISGSSHYQRAVQVEIDAYLLSRPTAWTAVAIVFHMDKDEPAMDIMEFNFPKEHVKNVDAILQKELYAMYGDANEVTRCGVGWLTVPSMDANISENSKALFDYFKSTGAFDKTCTMLASHIRTSCSST